MYIYLERAQTLQNPLEPEDSGFPGHPLLSFFVFSIKLFYLRIIKYLVTAQNQNGLSVSTATIQ